jgi:hypothetical protein
MIGKPFQHALEAPHALGPLAGADQQASARRNRRIQLSIDHCEPAIGKLVGRKVCAQHDAPSLRADRMLAVDFGVEQPPTTRVHTPADELAGHPFGGTRRIQSEVRRSIERLALCHDGAEP